MTLTCIHFNMINMQGETVQARKVNIRLGYSVSSVDKESYPPGLHHFKQFVVQPIRSSSVRPEIKRKVISRFQSNNVIPGIAKYQYCRVPASF